MSGFVFPDITAEERRVVLDQQISILQDAKKALRNSHVISFNDQKVLDDIMKEYDEKIKALENEKRKDDENITQPSADTIRREESMRANLQGQLIAALKNPGPVSTKDVQNRTKLFQMLHKSPATYGGGKKKSKNNKRMTKKLMCPKNCCGLPVLKCNCPKSCRHCNCQEIKRLRRLLRKKTGKRKKRRKKKYKEKT